MVDKQNIREIKISTDKWLIDGTFTISRGAKTHAEVVVVEISEAGAIGIGECVPYARYGETIDSVIEQIKKIEAAIKNGLRRKELLNLMLAGAARNAVDCALWDLEAKQSGKSVFELVNDDGFNFQQTDVVTAFTISLGSPGKMTQDAANNAKRDLLKIKLGGDGDIERMRAVRSGAPNSRLILDANEAWSGKRLLEFLNVAKEINADVVEQPLPADDDQILSQIERAVPVCADESVHTSNGLAALKDRYDCVNIKLDKAGGLTEALLMHKEARRCGFLIMVGCMVGTSLGMAPALVLAQDAEYVDLDGPLLLAKDRKYGLTYNGSKVSPPSPLLWG